MEAVDSCEAAREAAGGGRFDLVVVDANALGDERQTRLAALRHLASCVQPAMVAIMIADNGEDEAGRLLGAGAAQIVRKPIAASTLPAELRAGFTARSGVAIAPPAAISAA